MYLIALSLLYAQRLQNEFVALTHCLKVLTKLLHCSRQTSCRLWGAVRNFCNFTIKAEPLPSQLKNTQFERTFATLKIICSTAKQCITKDSPMQRLQWLIPQLRYAVYTIGFDEPNERQRGWALSAASKASSSLKVKK